MIPSPMNPIDDDGDIFDNIDEKEGVMTIVCCVSL